MNIVQSADQWTRVTTTIEARFWDGYLWRKEYSSDYFGGYRILKVGRTTQLAREWMCEFYGFDAMDLPVDPLPKDQAKVYPITRFVDLQLGQS